MTERLVSTDEQHDNGVHVNCDPDTCPDAYSVEGWHSHDYSGPLVCGCPELGS